MAKKKSPREILSTAHLVQEAIELREILAINPQNPGSLSGTLHSIAIAALNISEADYCAITLINPIQQDFVETRILTEEMGLTTPLIRKLSVKKSRLVDDIIEQQKTLLVIKDLARSQKYVDPFPKYGPTKSLVVLKLLTPRKRHPTPLAVVYLGYKQIHQVTDLDKRFFELLGLQSASVLQHTWSLRRYKEVGQIGQEINQDLVSNEVIFEKLVHHAPRILNTSYFFMMAVYDHAFKYLDYHTFERGKEGFIHGRPIMGACEWVLKNQEPLLVDNYEIQKEELEAKGIDIKHLEETEEIIPSSMLFVPMMIRGVPIGVLSIQQTESNAFDHEDRQIMELLANHVVVAISNLRLKKGLESLNETGQNLTQQLESENVTQGVIETIREVTQADIVSLHTYDNALGVFKFPILYSGEFMKPDFPSPTHSRPDDMANLVLQIRRPVFATNSDELYEELGGDPKQRKGGFEVREEICSTAALPLRVAQQPIGVLFLNFRSSQPFSEIQQKIISGLASYAAIAIRNSLLYGGATQRRIKDLETFRRVDRAISQTDELRKILYIIISEAWARLGESGGKRQLNGDIMLYDKSKDALVVEVAVGPNEEVRHGKPIYLKSGKGLTYWVMKNKEPLRVGNVKNDPQWKDLYYQVDEKTQSELDVPLLDENENVIGIISFESIRRNYFTQEDQDFLATLANQVVLAIKKAQTYEREKQLLAGQRAVQDVGREIVSQLDFNKVANLILDRALQLTKAKAGALFLYDAQQEELFMAADYNVTPKKRGAQMPLDRGLTGWVMRHRKSLNVNTNSPKWKKINQPWVEDVEWALVVPMLTGEDDLPLGTISLESKTAFSEYDEQLLSELADLAVIALENASSYQQVEEAAERMQKLYEVGNGLGELTDLSQLEQSYELVVRALTTDEEVQVVVRRYEAETQELKLVWQAKGEMAKGESVPFPTIELKGKGANVVAAKTKKVVIVLDTKSPPKGITPNLSDLNTRSLVVTPIQFRDKYYGNLALSHTEASYFEAIDVELIKGLAQLLGLTIYRLDEENQGRELESIGLISQIAFDFAHRIARDLGWIVPEFKRWKTDTFTREWVKVIIDEVQKFIQQGYKIKQVFLDHKDSENEIISVQNLLNEIKLTLLVPPENITFKWIIDSNLPNVTIYKSQIESIISNLVINAIDAMPEGGVITIKADCKNDMVRINVIDTGIGIPGELIHKIFDFRKSTKGSTGFGLWSAKRFARANGGFLKVKSQLGKGTTFTLFLPKG